MLLSLLVFALFFLQKIRISLFFYGNSPFGRFFMAWFIYLSCFIVMKRLNRIVKSTTAEMFALKEIRAEMNGAKGICISKIYVILNKKPTNFPNEMS